MTEQETLKKEPYEKPEIRVIDLKVDEVLAVGCKAGVGDAFGFPGCGIGQGCQAPGS